MERGGNRKLSFLSVPLVSHIPTTTSLKFSANLSWTQVNNKEIKVIIAISFSFIFFFLLVTGRIHVEKKLIRVDTAEESASELLFFSPYIQPSDTAQRARNG